MSAIPDHAEIYRKLHANRFEHVEQARRARDMQAELSALPELINVLEELKGELEDWYRYKINAQSDT
jgi:plasmid maintenance system killer protein